MLIPFTATRARLTSESWEGAFKGTWVLTILFAVLAFIAPPIDFISDPNRPLITGIGDRVLNTLLVVLVQNVFLAFLLFAVHVTRLLEGMTTETGEEVVATSVLTPSAPWTCSTCSTANTAEDDRVCRKCLRERRR